MKTYLLICFILLFYSINSVTKENCKTAVDSCNDHCETYSLISSKINCQRYCSKAYYECVKRAESGL